MKISSIVNYEYHEVLIEAFLFVTEVQAGHHAYLPAWDRHRPGRPGQYLIQARQAA